MINEPSIAVAFGSPGGPVAEMSIAVEELLSKRPKPVLLDCLAGPNETIQVLLNFEEWNLLVQIIAGLYGAEIVKEAAKSTWKNAVPIINALTQKAMDNIKSLTSAAKRAKHVEAPIVYGFPIDLPTGRRHIGIEIQEADESNISRTIAALSDCWPKLEKVIKQLNIEHEKGVLFSLEENSDCSTKIELTDNGEVLLKVTYYINGDYTSKKLVTFNLNSKSK